MLMIYVFIAIFILKLIFKTPKVRGSVGEAKIKQIIGSTCEVPGKEKYVINNLILESNGFTSQTDHVVINPNGIFVIETKNYSGTIYGNDEQKEWTQVLNYGAVKNSFYNPVKQNATHVRRIRSVIGSNFPIYSLVVFAKGNTSTIDSDYVYTPSELQKRLKQVGGKKLTQAEMQSAFNALSEANKSNVMSNAEHTKNVKRMRRNIEKGICPYCGGNLVVRHGKNGNFAGCSNYPKCRFTKSL